MLQMTHIRELSVRGTTTERDRNDIAEIVDSQRVHEPSWPRWVCTRDWRAVLPFPVIPNPTARLLNCGDGLALGRSAVADPAEHGRDDEDEAKQSPYAERSVSAPRRNRCSALMDHD